MAAEIDAEMKRIIEDAYHEAEEIVQEHRTDLDAIVEALLEKETLEAEDFERLLDSFKHDTASGTTHHARADGEGKL